MLDRLDRLLVLPWDNNDRTREFEADVLVGVVRPSRRRRANNSSSPRTIRLLAAVAYTGINYTRSTWAQTGYPNIARSRHKR